MAVIKVTSAGVLDTTFSTDGIYTHHNAANGNGNGKDQGDSIALDSSGKIYITGQSSNGSNSDFTVWKINTSGTLDTTFASGTGIYILDGAAGPSNIDRGFASVVDSNGNLYVSGESRNASLNSEVTLIKLKSDGTLDTDFNSVGYITVESGTASSHGNTVSIDSKGYIFVAGQTVGTNSDMGIWKFK